MLKNMACSLIEHKRIMTTLAKAKAMRVYLEPLITKCRDSSTHSMRVVFGYLQSKEAIKELFGPIAEKIGDRPGGYLRVIKTGFRHGDGAQTAMIEFVDYNEIYKVVKTSDSQQASQEVKKTTRRGGKKKTAAEEAAAEN